ncbi:MAG TPA: hypothetical protein H9827_03530 [Candidatus Luteimonas excrementigallinarum]|nr:hypothetical protein [Candidatus Luteimonas excrementigallinarum]
MRTVRLLTLLLAALVLAGCASSHMITGTPRPPIDPAQVRIYHGPPPGAYEEIAVLQTRSGALTYGEQNKIDSVLRKLREEAASLGANGVLLEGTADGYSGGGMSVGAGGGRIGGRGYGGIGVGVNISPTQVHATGIAIHVPDPPAD